MSLLMEALRKAEEAKLKGVKESDSDQSSERIEPDLKESESIEEVSFESDQPAASEAGGLQGDFDAAVSDIPSVQDEPVGLEFETQAETNPETVADDRDANSSWGDLGLHPMQAKPELDAAPVSRVLQAEEVADSEGLSAEAELEVLEDVAEEAISAEPRQTVLIDDYAVGNEEDPSEEEVDSAEVVAWKSRAKKLSNPRDHRKIAFLVVPLLFILGGVLFWFFGSEATPQVASPAPDRGFLGGPDPIELIAVEENPVGIEANINAPPITTSAESDASALQLGAAESVDRIVGDELAGLPQASVSSARRELVNTSSQQTRAFTITPSNRSPELMGLQTSASEAARDGYSAHAREQYEWLLTAEPNNTEALLGLARLDAAAGSIENARESYLRILELDPNNPLAQAGILTLESGAGDVLSDEAEIKSLVSRYPDAAPLAFVLGNLLASQQRWNEAEGAYSQALASAKSADASFVSPDYSFNLAVALEQLGKPDEAYPYYREALNLSSQIAPSFDLSLLNSRIAYLEQEL